MKRQTGATYKSDDYAKVLVCSFAKTGKTCWLISQLLGLFPAQTRRVKDKVDQSTKLVRSGGVVSSPAHLHVISFDTAALAGVRAFLQHTCKADPATTFDHIDIWNLEEDARATYASKQEYDPRLFLSVLEAINGIHEICASKPGVHALLVSSLFGMARPLERGIEGPVGGRGGENKGRSDISKWQRLEGQITEIQNQAQRDLAHCFWEGHVIQSDPPMQQNKNDTPEPPKDSLQVPGKGGKNFAINVSQTWKIVRRNGQKVEGNDKCDKVYIDTRPNFTFLSGGRNTTEFLEPQEDDLTAVLQKLGHKVGKFMAPAAAPSAPKPQKK